MFDQFVSNCLEGLFQITLDLGFPSYAVAIIVIAVVIRMLLMPLNFKQMQSTIAMQQIQPELEEIRNKYASNPELMQQKTMKLYQDYNINPLAGCLPMLIQFPILVGLYRGLASFVPSNPEYYRFFWIPDLSQVDTTYIMVFLVGASTLIQSLVVSGRPKQFMQWYMVIGIPAMMSWMAAKFPAFLCIYWLSITIIGILQQVVVTRPVKKRMQARQEELTAQRRKDLESKQNERNTKAQARANRAQRRHPAKEEQSDEADQPKERAPRQHKRRTRK